MGNSNGNFKPTTGTPSTHTASSREGFVWDWVDQGLLAKRCPGRPGETLLRLRWRLRARRGLPRRQLPDERSGFSPTVRRIRRSTRSRRSTNTFERRPVDPAGSAGSRSENLYDFVGLDFLDAGLESSRADGHEVVASGELPTLRDRGSGTVVHGRPSRYPRFAAAAWCGVLARPEFPTRRRDSLGRQPVTRWRGNSSGPAAGESRRQPEPDLSALAGARASSRRPMTRSSSAGDGFSVAIRSLSAGNALLVRRSQRGRVAPRTGPLPHFWRAPTDNDKRQWHARALRPLACGEWQLGDRRESPCRVSIGPVERRGPGRAVELPDVGLDSGGRSTRCTGDGQIEVLSSFAAGPGRAARSCRDLVCR